MTLFGLLCVAIFIKQQGARLSLNELQKTFQGLHSLNLLLAVVLIIIGYYMIFPPFCHLLEGVLQAKGAVLKNPVRKKIVFELFFQSNFAKYLPGNIFQFVRRSMLASTVNASQAQMGIVTILEIANFVFVNATFASLLLTFHLLSGGSLLGLSAAQNLLNVHFTHSPRLVGALISLCLLFLCGLVTGSIWYLKNKRAYNILERFKEINWIRVFSYNLGFCIINALVFCLVLLIYIPLEQFTVARIIETVFWFTTSYLIGYLVPGAPGGLGIREALLMLQLSSIYSPNALIATLVVSRLLAVLADVFWLASTYFTIKLRQQ